LLLHLLKADVLKDGVDDWLSFLWSWNLHALSHRHDSLGNDVVAVYTDVLEHRVGDEGVSGEFFEEINLLSLISFFEIKVILVRLASRV
jgi:hypothetical protein